MKRILSVVVVLMLVAPCALARIESINANYVTGNYTAVNGKFVLSDVADIVVEYEGGTQSTYDAGAFWSDVTLQLDLSSGGIAEGKFGDGSLKVLDSDGNPLLTGDAYELLLKEPFDNAGILTGMGKFLVTGGSLAPDFVAPGQSKPTAGEVVLVTFKMVPRKIDDFSKDFVSVSDVTLTPIPEPATMVMLGLGSLMLARRKR